MSGIRCANVHLSAEHTSTVTVFTSSLLLIIVQFDEMRDTLSLLTSWQLAGGFVLVLAVSELIYLISVRYRSGLRSIPGPFLASFSDLDRLWSVATGLSMNYHIRLHKQYGPLVRIGPKHVSFSDASLIPQVYGITTKFWKVWWE